jgi:nucleoside-triphosphatase THEP1
MKVAAVIYEKASSEAVDAMLSDISTRLRAEGYALAGAVQFNKEGPGGRCDNMLIEDLSTGRLMDISNPVRPERGGCRLNSMALEDAAGIIAAGLEGNIDLVVINRFGKQEAAGDGLRAAIEDAVAREIPLLTAVNATNRPAWDAFAADMSQALPPDLTAIEHWCRSVLTQKAAAGD